MSDSHGFSGWKVKDRVRSTLEEVKTHELKDALVSVSLVDELGGKYPFTVFFYD